MIVCGGCTRNDGNIGRQFGQWKLVRIETAGTADTSYEGNIFWSFQNTTVEMKRINAGHTAETTFGNYRIADDTLFITFPDEERPPLAGLGLQRSNELQIVRLTHSEMVLSIDSPDAADSGTASSTILYFHKW